jgi:thioredoxin-like negative regulator of GroEL
MIERLLAAEEALERDELDHAQRLFGGVADADPRNAIAVVGLARVLARRGDTDAARELVAHALEIDPDEAAAHRLLDELDHPRAVETEAPAPVRAAPGALPRAARGDQAAAPAAPTRAPAAPAASARRGTVRAPRGLLGRLSRLFRRG